MDNLFLTEIILLKNNNKLFYQEELETYIREVLIPVILKPFNIIPKFEVYTEEDKNKYFKKLNRCGYGATPPILIFKNKDNQEAVFYSQTKKCCVNSINEYINSFILLSERLCYNKQQECVYSIDGGKIDLNMFTLDDFQTINTLLTI
jgi:hypothetical protein